MKRVLVVANWKANPSSVEEARNLFRAAERALDRARRIECVIAPPFPFLSLGTSARSRVLLGAQDVFWAGGAFTGEVSPAMLASFGVRYAIVGHSERRMHVGETDHMIAKKIAAAIHAGITPILCVGERERTGRDIPEVVGDEIRRGLSGLRPADVGRVVIAYEPVWAVSTMPGASPDTPENAFRAKMYIRKVLAALGPRARTNRVRILYGGSVSAENVRAFMEEGEMDGVLVGGASIDGRKFSQLLRALR